MVRNPRNRRRWRRIRRVVYVAPEPKVIVVQPAAAPVPLNGTKVALMGIGAALLAGIFFMVARE